MSCTTTLLEKECRQVQEEAHELKEKLLKDRQINSFYEDSPSSNPKTGITSAQNQNQNTCLVCLRVRPLLEIDLLKIETIHLPRRQYSRIMLDV